MGYYEELDDEIDQEMGWADKIKKGAARRRRAGDTTSFIQHFAKSIRLPQPLSRAVKWMTRGAARLLFFPLISPFSYSKSFNLEGDMLVVKRSWRWRVIDAIVTRILLAPVIVGMFLIAVVYANTHPQRVQAKVTPESLGVYFKRVRLVTVDEQGLAAWYLPPITAGDMSFNPNVSLAQKWPGAVLCHGLGASQDQYLTLAQVLHDQGFAVLMVDMRGEGESDSAAVTYGLREWRDVIAGVKYLQELPNVDPAKVCVVGHDIGASAALQAANLDSSIAAIVADGLWPRFEERSHHIFAHPGAHTEALPTGWLAPLYTVAFEITLRDRLTQLDPEALARSIHTQPVLFIARDGPGYSPAPDVMKLASYVGAHHEVIVCEDNAAGQGVEERVRDFLVQSIKWKGPKAQGLESIEKLMEKRVK
jgi:pimeloyl-ACP methyl ester carboxylesterase